MVARKLIYNDVRREVFEDLSKLCDYENNNGYFSSITVKYNGTNLRGDIIIEFSGTCDTFTYAKAIQEIASIVAKNS